MKLKLLCIFIFIAGCSFFSSPPKMNYYLIDDSPQEEVSLSKNKKVKLNKMILPDYLEQNNLVLKRDNHQLEMAHYHSWAESLNKQIYKFLIKSLNRKSETFSFVSDCRECFQLDIEIQHFYPTQGGDVFLVGTYFVKKNNKIFSQENFNIKDELSKGGYDEAVKKMRNTLVKLSEFINEKLD